MSASNRIRIGMFLDAPYVCDAVEVQVASDVTVGIPTCDDNPRVFRMVLDALDREGVNEPTIVVDMSRGHAIAALARERADRVRYVPFPDSRGTSDSRNRIFDLAATRYLLFLDADAVPRPGWARALRGGFDRISSAAVVGARCLPQWPARQPVLYDTITALDFLGMFDLGLEPLPVPRIMGTSFAVDRERAPGPAPFPVGISRRPGYALAGEEVAYCRAVERHGWTIWYEPSAVVDHHVRLGRDRWAWMIRRAYTAGCESRLWRERLDPLPRRLGWKDHVFRALVAPAFAVGRIRGLPRIPSHDDDCELALRRDGSDLIA